MPFDQFHLPLPPQCADFETPEELVDQLAQKFSFAAAVAAEADDTSSGPGGLTKQESYARTVE